MSEKRVNNEIKARQRRRWCPVLGFALSVVFALILTEPYRAPTVSLWRSSTLVDIFIVKPQRPTPRKQFKRPRKRIQLKKTEPKVEVTELQPQPVVKNSPPVKPNPSKKQKPIVKKPPIKHKPIKPPSDGNLRQHQFTTPSEQKLSSGPKTPDIAGLTKHTADYNLQMQKGLAKVDTSLSSGGENILLSSPIANANTGLSFLETGNASEAGPLAAVNRRLSEEGPGGNVTKTGPLAEVNVQLSSKKKEKKSKIETTISKVNLRTTAKLRYKPLLGFPPEVGQRFSFCEVKLWILLSVEGLPIVSTIHAEIVKTIPASNAEERSHFIAEARRGAKEMRFHPPEIDGVPIESKVSMRVVFER